MGSEFKGKGSWPRKSSITVDEENIRTDLAFGRITIDEFNYLMSRINSEAKKSNQSG